MSLKNLEPDGLLILPRLRIQNANAISSPLTHGFPSMTAFLGFMWALGRKMADAGIPLKPEKIGVICHWHQEQVVDGCRTGSLETAAIAPHTKPKSWLPHRQLRKIRREQVPNGNRWLPHRQLRNLTGRGGVSLRCWLPHRQLRKHKTRR